MPSLRPTAKRRTGTSCRLPRVALGADRTFTLALGFGASQAGAVQAAGAARAAGFPAARKSYEAGWAAYDAGLKPPPKRLPGLSNARAKELAATYYLSANVLKASEDKTFPGAIVASLASPWGQAVSAGDPANTYFGSYREVFARDLYEVWTGLVAAGDLATARATVSFLFERQQLADGSMPRNSLINGKLAPDSFGTQLDETAYPIMMAHELGMSGAALYTDHIRPAANFLAAHGPAFGVERWEEQSGFSPSTIAAEIAGLIAAADLADANGDASSAAVWRGVADDFQRSIKGWTVTSTGPLARHPYFIRLSKTGDPNAAISYNLGNGGPTLDQRAVVDAGFLELSRLGALPAADPDILASLPIVDATIRSITSSGPGWHRYNGDGYGDRASDGRPWAPTGQGTGHLWPVLSAERGEHSIQRGDLNAAREPARRDGPFRVRRRPDPGAGLGAAGPRRVRIRHTFRDGVDRLPKRQGRRIRGAADLVGSRLCPAARRRRRRPDRDAAGEHGRALRHQHAGHDQSDRHEPARPVGRDRLSGHGDRHLRSRQPDRTSRRRTPTTTPRRRRRQRQSGPVARSASTCRSRGERPSSTSSP